MYTHLLLISTVQIPRAYCSFFYYNIFIISEQVFLRFFMNLSRHARKGVFMGRHTQYIVSLSQEEKNKLQAMSKDNKLSARVSKRVLILLALDDKKNSNLNEKLNSICGLSQ